MLCAEAVRRCGSVEIWWDADMEPCRELCFKSSGEFYRGEVQVGILCRVEERDQS